MALLRLGSRGPDVKGVQSRLNTRLSPSPKLSVDGVFGTQTDAAVKRFQQSQRLTVDGIVGPLTMKSLAAPPPGPAPANLQKFVSQLGTVGDFVSHVRQEEANSTNRGELLGKFGNFFTTASGARYLLVQGDDVGVIDFRHFFAAAAESYNSNQSRGGIGVALGGSPGQSVLLGVGNEMAQCFDEAVKRKRNSCFSPEDLGSNRLGAAFGELVKVREAEASATPVSTLLEQFLNARQPVTANQVSTVKTAGRWDQMMEVLNAILSGIGDILIPRAY